MRGFFNFVNRIDVKTGFDAYTSAVQDDSFVGTLTREQAKRDYDWTIDSRGLLGLSLM